VDRTGKTGPPRLKTEPDGALLRGDSLSLIEVTWYCWVRIVARVALNDESGAIFSNVSPATSAKRGSASIEKFHRGMLSEFPEEDSLWRVSSTSRKRRDGR
jgi:hypothetical protein